MSRVVKIVTGSGEGTSSKQTTPSPRTGINASSAKLTETNKPDALLSQKEMTVQDTRPSLPICPNLKSWAKFRLTWIHSDLTEAKAYSEQ